MRPLLTGVGVVCAFAAAAFWAAETTSNRADRAAAEAGFHRASAEAAAVRQFAQRVLSDTAEILRLAQRWVDLDAVGETALRLEIERLIERGADNDFVYVDRVTILTADGQPRWISGLPVPAVSLADRGYFRRHQEGVKGPLVGRPLIGRASGETLIPITIRLHDGRGAFNGAAVALVRPGTLARELALLAGQEGTEALLLRADGELLAASAEVGQRVGQRLFPTGATAAFGAAATGTLRGASPITGREQFMAWQRVGDADLIALAALDTGQQLAGPTAARRSARLTAGVATATIALAVLAWGLWLRSATAAREAAAQRAGRADVERLHVGLPALIFVGEVGRDGSARRLYRGGVIAEVTGWAADQLEHLPNLESLSDYGDTPMTAHLRQVVREGSGAWEWRMRRPDGSWSWMRSQARVLARRPDGVVEMVGYTLNIDRERNAEAKAMASARLASLGEMATGLAHELRQPLAALSLAAEIGQLALAAGDTAKASRRFDVIVAQAERANKVIEHLRRFARDPGSAELKEPVSLAAAIDGALTLFGGALREASIEIEITLGEPSPVVRGEQVAMEQVLLNLMINARDALIGLPTGARRRLAIGASTEPVAGVVQLTVADTGGGIAPEIMGRLFEPFATMKRPDKGTGLGLSICHGLIKAMGGSIQAHNDSEGAVFTITLQAVREKMTTDVARRLR